MPTEKEKPLEKDKFIKLLKEQDWNVTDENGVVLVLAKKEDYPRAYSQIEKLAEQSGYKASFGVRQKQSSKSTE